MHAALVDAPAASIAPKSQVADKPLLEIDAAEFRAGFDRRPFLIRHRLSNHPLFELPRLRELAKALPADNVEYNAGNIPISLAPELTPRTGLSAEDTIRRIAQCTSWLVLKYVEHDPDYRALLTRCLAEVAMHSEPLRPGMCLPQAFVFITSPGSVTPYHMDPEHNFLMQIHGSKKISMFDGRDHSILSQEELERFYEGAHRNLVFADEFRAKAWTFNLEPGDGLHFPVTFPHYVQNGSDVSISFSITFRTPDLDRVGMLHMFNALLRRRGIRPAPPGRHPWRDTLKCFTWRMCRRIRRWFGGRS